MDFNCKTMGYTHHIFERPGSDIKKTGYLRKLKTMKKKFFVLRSTSSSGPARLEYYGSEKKFQAGTLPKRSIQLHTCFNINRRSDTRGGRWGVVLYTVQDSFTVLTESEEEQEAWLVVMLEYQNEYLPDGDKSKEHYEHVWQVTMQPRGLGQGKGNKGIYRMCLNSSTISLFKVNSTQPQFIIQLVTIRAVAHHENSFRLTVGNYASTGPGEFYFTVDSVDSAKDIHTTVLDFMSSVQDSFLKDQQFNHLYPRDAHTSLHDGFGGTLQLHVDPRKSYSGRGRYSEDAGLDFIKDPLNRYDVQKDMPPPICPNDLDGDVSPYVEFPKPDFASLISHSSHQSAGHSHNFSEHQFLAHLPTVKEVGSGEGHLLSDIPASSSDFSEIPRPEPAVCFLSDDHSDLPPRTYSLGSKPTKKFQGYTEVGSRRGTDNEISRATSAPHIVKGKRDREHAGDESITPAVSPLSMSLKSDDSDSFVDFMPIRPRTASDSFNDRPRTFSGGKLQQTCRPRSSSYGQGKRPVINMNKLRQKNAMMSLDTSQRTSRESSLLGSFESLRVSQESLRRNSQDLRLPGGFNMDDADLRSTPSPQMRNMSDYDLQCATDKRKCSPNSARRDSFGSLRSVTMVRGSDQRHPQHINDYTNMAPPNSGSDSSSGQAYVNVDYGTRNSDIKPIQVVSQIQSSTGQDGIARYKNIESDNRNKRSSTCRSASMENVDTYFIPDSSLYASKPRTGSCGSKDKNRLRPEAAKQLNGASVVPTTSSSRTKHQPPSQVPFSRVISPQQHFSVTSSFGGVPHQQSHHQSVPAAGMPQQQHHHQQHRHHQQPPLPLACSSTRSFGSSDSIRKSSSMEKTVAANKDFRKKSGSTGSRPVSSQNSLHAAKEQIPYGCGMMASRKPPSTKFSEDEPTYQIVDFTSNVTRSDYTPSHGPSNFQPSRLPHSNQHGRSSRSGSFSSGDCTTLIHSNSISFPAEQDSYVMCDTFSSYGHHHSPLLSSLSSMPSQTKNIPGNDDSYYVPPDLGKTSSIPPRVARNQRNIETKDKQSGFKHPSSSVSSIITSSGHKPISAKEQDEYVDYQPSSELSPSESCRHPISVASQILSSRTNEVIGKPKLKQHMSLETGTSVNKSHNPSLNFSNRALTSDLDKQSESTSSAAQYSLPPIPPLPAPTLTPRRTPSSIKESGQDECGSYYFFDASSKRGNLHDTLGHDPTSPNMAVICSNSQFCRDINSSSPDCADAQNSNQSQTRYQQTPILQRQLSTPSYSSTTPNLNDLPHHNGQCVRTQPSDKTFISSTQPVSIHELSTKSYQEQSQTSKTLNSFIDSSSKTSPHFDSISVSDIFPYSTNDGDYCQLSESDKFTHKNAERNIFKPNKGNYAEIDVFNSSKPNAIPTTIRTRHSLGDVMSVVGIERLKRHTKSNSDAMPISHPSCKDSLKLILGPRSRHSLSDLGSCSIGLSSGEISSLMTNSDSGHDINKADSNKDNHL